MAAIAEAEPGQGQELESSSEFPIWVAAAQALGPSLSAFPGALAGSWIGSGVPETQTGALIENLDVASGSFISCSHTGSSF